MEKHKNDLGRWIYSGVSVDDEFGENLFSECDSNTDEHRQVVFHSNLGSLTIVDRMTGFGWRDTETGYRDKKGNFWLATGALDVRFSGAKTIGDAINWVKAHANTVVPDLEKGR